MRRLLPAGNRDTFVTVSFCTESIEICTTAHDMLLAAKGHDLRYPSPRPVLPSLISMSPSAKTPASKDQPLSRLFQKPDNDQANRTERQNL